MALAAGQVREFRGAWVTAWAEGFLTREQADETVRLAKDAHLNALFIQVRKAADAYYKSEYEPRATNISGSDDYDPLAYMIRKAHASGIEVHAWLNTFRVCSKQFPSNPNHIANLHTDWLTRTADGNTKGEEGYYLDPGVPEAADYTFNVFMDVVKNYDIDGIHFDYIRYPGQKFGYAPAAVERFNQETGRTGTPDNGDEAWRQWRRDQVTNLVRRIYKAAVLSKPNIKVTAATIPWGDCKGDFCDTSPFTGVYQDWRTWMEEGIIDANIPMNYKDESREKNALQFRNWLAGFKKWEYDRQVYCGIDFSQSPNLVLRQMEAARKRGIIGMVGFAFNQTPARVKLVQALKYGPYSEQASVPEMSWKMSVRHRVSRERYAQAINAATMGRDLDKAIDLLKEALEIDPDYVDAHFRLGRCYLRKENYPEAVKEFEAALALNPDYVSASEQLDIARSKMQTQEEGTPVETPLTDETPVIEGGG